MIIITLKIEINYLEIMFVLHMKISYKIMNYMQKSEYAKQEKKIINLIILMKNNKT